ncbi:DUF4136 domain-containing protein [Rubritalea spongiae]|uniref:DUF4136 domain-containing protein n=1 Tax=Rubritalea spongiae TaxID=430797 RepID=A0ABW5DZW2_9BACT
MTALRLLAVAACAAVFTSCSSSVDMPKGNSKGYQSARLVKRAPNEVSQTAVEKQVHGLIQNSLKQQFSSRGLAYNQPNADLVVAYMVIYQDNAMTTSYDDYFGYGRDANAILGLAHERGVIKGDRPDYFERAGLVVDVVDAKTNKLVFRNVAVGDIVKGASSSQRAARVNAAVNEALAPFFK